jgi:hypothetical protein
LFNFVFQVVLLVSVYVVSARPTETSVPSTTTESVDVRQGWNQGQQNGNSYPNRQQTQSNPIATGSYPAGSNSRPYGNDNTIANELNFPGADAHRAIASMFNMNLPSTSGGFIGNPVQKQMAGFDPTGYQAPGGVSASASAVSVSSQ